MQRNWMSCSLFCHVKAKACCGGRHYGLHLEVLIHFSSGQRKSLDNTSCIVEHDPS